MFARQSWVYQTKSVENIAWNICNSLKSKKMASFVETNTYNFFVRQSWVYQTKSVENITWNICNSLKSETNT